VCVEFLYDLHLRVCRTGRHPCLLCRAEYTFAFFLRARQNSCPQTDKLIKTYRYVVDRKSIGQSGKQPSATIQFWSTTFLTRNVPQWRFYNTWLNEPVCWETGFVQIGNSLRQKHMFENNLLETTRPEMTFVWITYPVRAIPHSDNTVYFVLGTLYTALCGMSHATWSDYVRNSLTAK